MEGFAGGDAVDAVKVGFNNSDVAVMSARSSTRMRHESSAALKKEKRIAISTAPNANGKMKISAQTIT